jgi:hypothetical protein
VNLLQDSKIFTKDVQNLFSIDIWTILIDVLFLTMRSPVKTAEKRSASFIVALKIVQTMPRLLEEVRASIIRGYPDDNNDDDRRGHRSK